MTMEYLYLAIIIASSVSLVLAGVSIWRSSRIEKLEIKLETHAISEKEYLELLNLKKWGEGKSWWWKV